MMLRNASWHPYPHSKTCKICCHLMLPPWPGIVVCGVKYQPCWHVNTLTAVQRLPLCQWDLTWGSGSYVHSFLSVTWTIYIRRDKIHLSLELFIRHRVLNFSCFVRSSSVSSRLIHGRVFSVLRIMKRTLMAITISWNWNSMFPIFSFVRPCGNWFDIIYH